MVEGARLENVFCGLIYAFSASAPSFPALSHLPVAPTEGSLDENFNITGVRLWT